MADGRQERVPHLEERLEVLLLRRAGRVQGCVHPHVLPNGRCGSRNQGARVGLFSNLIVKHVVHNHCPWTGLAEPFACAEVLHRPSALQQLLWVGQRNDEAQCRDDLVGANDLLLSFLSGGFNGVQTEAEGDERDDSLAGAAKARQVSRASEVVPKRGNGDAPVRQAWLHQKSRGGQGCRVEESLGGVNRILLKVSHAEERARRAQEVAHFRRRGERVGRQGQKRREEPPRDHLLEKLSDLHPLVRPENRLGRKQQGEGRRRMLLGAAARVYVLRDRDSDEGRRLGPRFDGHAVCGVEDARAHWEGFSVTDGNAIERV
eukprot:scaffold193_cov255-Pinguiococcus_pyrenoidosus.AAC.13